MSATLKMDRQAIDFADVGAPIFPPYEPDRSLGGKVRRRVARLQNRRPAPGVALGPRLTISFDDVPLSATRIGADILRARGGRATYYVAAGLVGGQGPMGAYAAWSDLRRLAAEGHEIGCHTFAHTDLGQADARAAEQAVRENEAAFAQQDLPSPTTFAYPYGDVAAEPKATLASRYGLLRALHHGLIEAGADLNQAPSVGLEGPGGERQAMAWLQRAARRQAWLILTTHDVARQPSRWGCTPDGLARVLDQALTLGFQIVTAAEGVRQLA
jgi:peptidoglycan/xylan/chitin deacetylase (PgdA/CDA1 family)